MLQIETNTHVYNSLQRIREGSAAGRFRIAVLKPQRIPHGYVLGVDVDSCGLHSYLLKEGTRDGISQLDVPPTTC